MQFASNSAVFQILLDKIHLYFCVPFPLISTSSKCLEVELKALIILRERDYIKSLVAKLNKSARRCAQAVHNGIPSFSIKFSAKSNKYIVKQIRKSLTSLLT